MTLFPTRHRSIIHLLMLAGIAALFIASFMYIIQELNLVIDPRAQRSAPQAEESAPPAGMGFAISPEATDELGKLMTNLQRNPNDPAVLLQIADIFMSAGEWARAESFLQRAVLSAPGNTDARIMLAISRFQQGNFQNAAQTLEELLDIKKDPIAMFNLGIIYKHNLAEPAKAEKLFRDIIASPDAEPEVVEKAKAELQK